MNFSQLQSFVALAEMGSFTEAAYTVNLTQSAVSHALAALENELGVTLLERNRTGVVALTNVGEKIIPHVRALLAQAEAIEQEAKAAHGPEVSLELEIEKLPLGVPHPDGSLVAACHEALAIGTERHVIQRVGLAWEVVQEIATMSVPDLQHLITAA